MCKMNILPFSEIDAIRRVSALESAFALSRSSAATCEGNKTDSPCPCHGSSRDARGSASAALGAPKHAYPRRCRPRWRRRRGGPCEATIVSTVTTAGDHQPRLSRDVRSISFRSAASWSLTHPPRNKCSQENPTSAPFDRLFVGPSGLTCCVGSLPRRDLSRKHVVPFYHCTSSHHGGT